MKIWIVFLFSISFCDGFQNNFDPRKRPPMVLGVSAMCSLNGITVSIDFDQPFTGKIYSVDYANIHECIYYNAQEMQNLLFTIPLHRCGTRITRNTREVIDTVENRVYVQIDKYTQTADDRQYSFLCELVHSKALMGIDGKDQKTENDVRRHPVAESRNKFLPVAPIQPINNFQKQIPLFQTPPESRVQNSLNSLPIVPTSNLTNPFFFPKNQNYRNPLPASDRLLPVKPVNSYSDPYQNNVALKPSTFFTTKTSTELAEPSTKNTAPETTLPQTISTMAPKITAENLQNTVKIYATQQLNNSELLSDIILEIQQGDGPKAKPVNKPVKIGETLTLVVKTNKLPKDPKQYNIFVHSCYANDGPGTTKVELIDQAGCPVSPQIIGNMERERNDEFITYYFKIAAFKFPGPDDVYFSCLVDTSPHYNFPELCKKSSKKKRELITAAVESFPVFKDIKVNLDKVETNASAKETFSSTENNLEQLFCLSYLTTLITFSVIILLSFSTSLSFGIIYCLYRKLAKRNKF